MMERRCTSVIKIVIESLQLIDDVRDVVEEKFRFRQELALEAAAEDGHDRQRDAMGGQDVVRRVSNGKRSSLVRSGALERRTKDLRRRFRVLRVFLRRRSLDQFFDAEKLRIVLDL